MRTQLSPIEPLEAVPDPLGIWLYAYDAAMQAGRWAEC
jgi:hypothetical protein